MLKRHGITLIELLVVVVMMGIIGTALSRIFTTVMGASSAQVRIAATQGEARVGTLLLPQEFREIGYDANDATGVETSDLVTIAADQIQFFASRGLGITCGTPTIVGPVAEFRIRRATFGQRVPLITDRFRLFLELDVNLASDDQWIPMVVTNIDLSSTCDGSEPAIRFTAVTPQVDLGPPAGLSDIVLSNHRIGGPIRWFEQVEYHTATDATTGELFVTRRSISLGEAVGQPIIGPLAGTGGFALTYYDAAGNVVNPTTANPLVVRSIDVAIRTTTNSNVSLAGSTTRAVSNFPVVTRVSLRNSLRP